MPIALDPTVGGAAANTYASIVEVDAWALADVNGATWTALTADQKAALLARSARLLDQSYEWAGIPVNEVQAMQWPRYPVVKQTGAVWPSDVIPAPLKDAHVELTLWLAGQGITNDPFQPDAGLVRIGVGPISLDYGTRAPDSAGVKFLDERIAPKLQQHGLVDGNASSQRRLVR